MSKLQSELTHKELEVKKQDTRHVMVQTEDDQCDQMIQTEKDDQSDQVSN